MMKILLIGASQTNDTMEKHVVAALKNLGHEVVHHNTDRFVGVHPKADRLIAGFCRLTLREPERIHEPALLKKMLVHHPDLILVLLGSNVSPKTLRAIRNISNCRIVVWCQDQMVTLGRQYLIGSGYDHIFVKDHYLQRVFSDIAGIKNVHYLPEACNPSIHRTVDISGDEQIQYGCDVSTFGSLYYFRQSILERLTDYDLKVWGAIPDWLVYRLGKCHMGRSIFEDEKCKAIRASKIVLNTLHFGEISGLNCRAFEVAACGGFQLMSYSAAAHEHFVHGKEIVMFENLAELRSLIDFYLRRPDLRSEIALAAQKRAHKDHTYEKRLETLLKISTA